MKTTKIITIATVATILLIALCGVTTATAETADTYRLTAVVTAWEQIDDSDLYVISVTDESGNVWDFIGEKEDTNIGNLYVLIMHDMGNAHEEDDEIEDAVFVTRLGMIEIMNFLP